MSVLSITVQDLIEELQQFPPQTRVLILTRFDDEDYYEEPIERVRFLGNKVLLEGDLS